MRQIDEICRDLEVIRRLSDGERTEFCRQALSRSYQPREVIAHAGEAWPCLLVVGQGMINVTKSSAQGRVLGALRLEEGGSFWSPSLLDGRSLPASLEAREECRVFIWHEDVVLPLIRMNPDALWDLVQVLSRRMHQASGYIEELGFQPLASRLARLMLNLAEDTEGQQVSRDMTLEEMAAITGTTSVMVCKLLSRFADEGLIKVSRTEFELTDRNQLGDLADASN